MEYAKGVVSQVGLQKPSSSTLAKVAEELFIEFQRTGLTMPQPFFKKAHRWLVSTYIYIFIVHFPLFCKKIHLRYKNWAVE